MTLCSILSHTICFLNFHVNCSMLIPHFLDLSLHATTLHQCVHISFAPFQQETSSHVEYSFMLNILSQFSRITSWLSQVRKVKPDFSLLIFSFCQFFFLAFPVLLISKALILQATAFLFFSKAIYINGHWLKLKSTYFRYGLADSLYNKTSIIWFKTCFPFAVY